MTRTLSAAALTFAVLITASARAQAPAPTLIMKTQFLHDDGLDKDAYSLLVPQNWKLQGAIEWQPNLPTPFVDISVANPTDHLAFRQFPRLPFVAGVRENFEAAFPGQRGDAERRFAEGQYNADGYEIRKIPASPREYILTILAPKLCPEVANAKDLKITAEEALPDLAQSQAAGDPARRQFTSGRVRMTYTASDGPVEREFIVTLIVQQYPPHRGPGPSAMWLADASTSRAPAGKLDANRATFTAIGSSIKPLLPWFNLEVQTAAMFIQQQQRNENKMLGDQRDAINERMRILRDEARQSQQIISDSVRSNFRNQQAAKDQMHRQFMHYVNDTAAYKSPTDGSVVTLDAGYKYQYMSNNGDVIQTNDATFKPPVDPQISWQPMERSNQ